MEGTMSMCQFGKLFVMIAVLLLQGIISTQPKEHEPHNPINKEHYPEGKHDASFDHESILGSKAAEEEFSQLSPEKAKERLAELVNKMDKNSDGSVDKSELKEWVKNSFQKLDREEAISKHKEQDTDGDGKVTWADYLNEVYSYKPDDIEEFRKDKSDDMKSFVESVDAEKKKFDTADKNGDGALDSEEYGAFFHPQDYPEMADLEVSKTLEEFDKNKDGKISEDEYITNAGVFDEESGEDKVQREVEREQFREYDKDGNGFLGKEEIQSWTIPDTEEIAEEEVNHLFSESDADQDGRLSQEEIVAQHDLWVGSSATAYGDHLAAKDEL